MFSDKFCLLLRCLTHFDLPITRNQARCWKVLHISQLFHQLRQGKAVWFDILCRNVGSHPSSVPTLLAWPMDYLMAEYYSVEASSATGSFPTVNSVLHMACWLGTYSPVLEPHLSPSHKQNTQCFSRKDLVDSLMLEIPPFTQLVYRWATYISLIFPNSEPTVLINLIN